MLTLAEKQNEYLAGMDTYISNLKKLSSSEQHEYSQKSLIRSGVLNKNGKIKKQICT